MFFFLVRSKVLVLIFNKYWIVFVHFFDIFFYHAIHSLFACKEYKKKNEIKKRFSDDIHRQMQCNVGYNQVLIITTQTCIEQ
jgi:hypothetical protein